MFDLSTWLGGCKHFMFFPCEFYDFSIVMLPDFVCVFLEIEFNLWDFGHILEMGSQFHQF